MDVAGVEKLVKDWYEKLDVHAPMVEVLPLLVDSGLEMQFPEATLYSLADFEGWYQGVIRLFFDEVHLLKKVEVNLQEDRAEVDIIVQWEASFWKAPAAHSQRIVADAYQTWVVVPDSDGNPRIQLYVVDKLDFHPGSAQL
ncbi:hypothetical protein [Deinococcus roseus]|uniref:SnoaL-like domain-containing protein n=1 Tax=Deinococcus roseus TaxID=392414 RepID=A0ABQ2DB17_9DEIO|nr:hypothetical protein [Deinococcus roseus]GGJ52168.1 hypothetical protein GCM10008938_42730 [Deinococcus roseus]